MKINVMSDNLINVDWCEAIVHVSIKSPKLAMHSKAVSVKFKETGGDKAKALELALERLLISKEVI